MAKRKRTCKSYKMTRAGRRCASYGQSRVHEIQDLHEGVLAAFDFYAERIRALEDAIARVDRSGPPARGRGLRTARYYRAMARHAYRDAQRNYDNAFITDAVVGLGDVAVALEKGWDGVEPRRQPYGG